jgi:hypothetical protein
MAYTRKRAGCSLLKADTLDEWLDFAECSRKFLGGNYFAGLREITKAKRALMFLKISCATIGRE